MNLPPRTCGWEPTVAKSVVAVVAVVEDGLGRSSRGQISEQEGKGVNDVSRYGRACCVAQRQGDDDGRGKEEVDEEEVVEKKRLADDNGHGPARVACPGMLLIT